MTMLKMLMQGSLCDIQIYIVCIQISLKRVTADNQVVPRHFWSLYSVLACGHDELLKLPLTILTSEGSDLEKSHILP